ncbi:hypothetical protein BBP40_007858 [Aspergillus hancockii]|nr:hypothetical protein BBP40_007858 [Aspergillus hancockii]
MDKNFKMRQQFPTQQTREHSDTLQQIFEVNIVNMLDRAQGQSFIGQDCQWLNKGFLCESSSKLRYLVEDPEKSPEHIHKGAITLADENSATNKNGEIPKVILGAYCHTLGQELKQVEAKMKSEQEELNRIFAKTIEVELEQTYQECVGTGDYYKYTLIRMRNIMAHQAEDSGAEMLRKGAEQTLEKIIGLLKFKNEATRVIQPTEANIHLDQNLGLKEETTDQLEIPAAPEAVVKTEYGVEQKPRLTAL